MQAMVVVVVSALTALSLCRDIDGLSLPAAVRCDASERVQRNAAGRLVRKLNRSSVETHLDSSHVLTKSPWHEGTAHLPMSPMEFVQRHIDGQLCHIEFCDR